MHTGSMSNDGLLRLESLLWGDTKDSSLIQLAISHQDAEEGPPASSTVDTSITVCRTKTGR